MAVTSGNVIVRYAGNPHSLWSPLCRPQEYSSKQVQAYILIALPLSILNISSLAEIRYFEVLVNRA
jgi:hypothetical protein